MIGDGRQRRLLQVIVPLELLHCLQNAVGNHRWVGHREGLEPLVVQRLAHYASPDPPSRTRQSLRRVDRQESLDEALALGRELAPVSLREGNGVDLHVLQRERGHGGRQRVVTREQEVGDDAQRPHVAGLAEKGHLAQTEVDQLHVVAVGTDEEDVRESGEEGWIAIT